MVQAISLLTLLRMLTEGKYKFSFYNVNSIVFLPIELIVR
jgi:hypothetical protein